MRFLFYILSVTTALSSTQPLWDVACKSLVGECGISVCEESACTPVQEEKSPDSPIRQCCPSFQCCFLAFGAFSTPYSISFEDVFLGKTSPAENVETLSSTFIQEYFDPPDVVFSANYFTNHFS